MGLATCQFLARDGASIAVLDMNGEAAENVVRMLQKEGAKAVAAEVDVSDRGQVDAAVDQVHKALGPVHILVTSAGISRFEPFREITEDSWDRVMAVNLKGTFNCVQAMIDDMIEAHWGRIILISSSSAQRGAARMVHYSSSKAALFGMTRSLAHEFGQDGITVNCVPPNSIDTPMLRWAAAAGHTGGGGASVEESGAARPVGRIGQPEDIAAACSYLASEEASYVTGQILGVNGGGYM
jgi:2-hydroxycyclohexanecarboxyl-CoA dehydrogenase